GRHQIYARPYTRPSVSFPEARQNRTGSSVWRPVSLSRRDDTEGRTRVRLQQGTDCKEPRDDRGVRQECQGTALDPARRGSKRQAQEIAGVLRLNRAGVRCIKVLHLTLGEVLA